MLKVEKKISREKVGDEFDLSFEKVNFRFGQLELWEGKLTTSSILGRVEI